MKKLLLITSFLASQLFAVECTEKQYSPFFTDKNEIRYMLSHYDITDNSRVVIDKKSISYDKTNYKIVCWTIQQDMTNPKIGIAKIRWEFNLSNNTVRGNAIVYDCNGNKMFEDNKGNWINIVPESSSENTLNDLKEYLNIK